MLINFKMRKYSPPSPPPSPPPPHNSVMFSVFLFVFMELPFVAGPKVFLLYKGNHAN